MSRPVREIARRKAVAATRLWGPCLQGCRRSSSGSTQPPLVLVLDVDETLWRSHISGVHTERTRKPFKRDFTVTARPTARSTDLDGSAAEPTLQDGDIGVALRPGLAQFFEWIRLRRSEGLIEGPWIFTQASNVYLNSVMEHVDPAGVLFGNRKLTRDSCTSFRKPWPWVHKELTQVPEALPERAILVENNPLSGLLYPDNLLMVHDWTGTQEHDRELERVSATIDAVLMDTKGTPGHYAEKLRDITIGHAEFKKALDKMHKTVREEPLEGKTAEQSIKNVWIRALRAKNRLIDQQPRQASNKKGSDGPA